jgi:predicted Fe-Mo cluster-binding NifX family protein
MKIAIPTAGGRLAAHFGHCEQFALIEVDAELKSILSSTMLTPPAHEPGLLPRWLHEQEANVIISGGMGQRARDLFTERGIDVVVGAPDAAPHEIAAAYLNGTLIAGENFCDH